MTPAASRDMPVSKVEFYRPDDIHDVRVFGVAKDNAGNIYKLVVGNT